MINFISYVLFRHDWYQTETHVVLTLMIKNRKKDDVEIEFGKQNVSLLFCSSYLHCLLNYFYLYYYLYAAIFSFQIYYPLQ